jgi:hypothetical protein
MSETLLPLLLGGAFIGSVLYADQIVSEQKEQFSQEDEKIKEMKAKYAESVGNGNGQAGPSVGPSAGYPAYPQNKMFYAQENRRANAMMAQANPSVSNVQSNRPFAGPPGGVPQSQANISLSAGGDQLLSYQLYQQGINAATPTLQQLNSISGESQQQTGNDAMLKGGVSSNFAPYNILGTGPELYNSEYQAVNLGNPRAESISTCAQNSPSEVATSLLPKPSVPGQNSWDISAPQNILANQNFLSATQQVGVDTVLSSLRNASKDIRGDVTPNPINTVSPWLNTTIQPDLERRPLQCGMPSNGLYGCGTNLGGSYVGYTD